MYESEALWPPSCLNPTPARTFTIRKPAAIQVGPPLGSVTKDTVCAMQGRLPEGSQTHFRSIVTDQYLRVLGSEGSIYAIGDAATIQQASFLLLRLKPYECKEQM